MTIEEKALKLWGEAICPCDAIWILQDGTLVNGHMGFKLIRNVDHADIGQFFKPSKFQDPGSNWVYIQKFMRRRNIRMAFTGTTAFFELAKPPTISQWQSMGKCFIDARKLGLPVEISRMGNSPGTRVLYNREGYIRYLKRYTKGIIPD